MPPLALPPLALPPLALPALALAVLMAIWMAPAMAFECGKATTDAERAICADPDLKALDDRMAAAYTALRATMTTAERTGLALSQKSWIFEREACVERSDGAALCIGDKTRGRLRLLLGRAESGPGVGSRIAPSFIARAADGDRYGLEVTLLRFATPESDGQRRLNELADSLEASLPGRVPSDASNPEYYFFSTAMRVTYAGPVLISAEVDFGSYDGGAHGSTSTQHANILADGSFLAADQVFSAKAQARITADCRDQIATIKARRAALDGRIYDAASDLDLNLGTVAEHTASSEYWGLSDQRMVVDFDPYEVGFYAEGAFQCSFSLSDLRALALPGAVLP